MGLIISRGTRVLDARGEKGSGVWKTNPNDLSRMNSNEIWINSHSEVVFTSFSQHKYTWFGYRSFAGIFFHRSMHEPLYLSIVMHDWGLNLTWNRFRFWSHAFCLCEWVCDILPVYMESIFVFASIGSNGQSRTKIHFSIFTWTLADFSWQALTSALAHTETSLWACIQSQRDEEEWRESQAFIVK